MIFTNVPIEFIDSFLSESKKQYIINCYTLTVDFKSMKKEGLKRKQIYPVLMQKYNLCYDSIRLLVKKLI